jgi:hypothetical protein
MPARSQFKIRRDINRLNETVQHYKNKHPSLAAIAQITSEAAERVNKTWQSYQSTSIKGSKERQERNKSIKKLLNWIHEWRDVVMIRVPGAEMNIHKLPSDASTPDDVIRVAEDIIEFFKTNETNGSIRADFIKDLGDILDNARKETDEATEILPEESDTRKAYHDVSVSANKILLHGTRIVRSIFGRTSPEYKQFISRSGESDKKKSKEDSNESS